MRATRTGLLCALLLGAGVAIAGPGAGAVRRGALAVVPSGAVPMALAFVLGGGLFGAAVCLQRRRGRRKAHFEQAVWERTRSLLAADRLTSLGSLAAAVAHELNNPLTFVGSNLRFVKGELEVGSGADVVDLTVALGEALEGAERMAEIVRDLRRLTRCDGDDAGGADVVSLLDAATNVTFGPARGKARLVKELRAVPRVALQEARLGQVLLDLLLYTVQSLRLEAGATPTVRIATWTGPDGRVAIEIGGDGPRLGEAQLAPVFAPFNSDGTDRVGLAISEALVGEAGGEIAVRSHPGEGTCFRVLLPAARPVPRRTGAALREVVILDEDPPVAPEAREVGPAASGAARPSHPAVPGGAPAARAAK